MSSPSSLLHMLLPLERLPEVRDKMELDRKLSLSGAEPKKSVKSACHELKSKLSDRPLADDEERARSRRPARNS